MGSGAKQATFTVSHPNAQYSVKYNVLFYDTQEDYNSFNLTSFYSYETNKTLFINDSVNLQLETSDNVVSSNIHWEITSGNDLISIETLNQNKTLSVTALKPGNAIIKASYPNCDDIYFVVNIENNQIVNVLDDCYLSTSNNVMYFEKIGESQNLTIDLVNISQEAYKDLSFNLSNNNFEIVSNNNTVTITSLVAEGSSILTITHPLSENELIVYLKSGSQYEYVNEDVCYISTNKEVFELYPNQNEVSLIASLNHTESDDTGIAKGFSFEIDNKDIAQISYVNYSNTCYIKPLKNGTAKIKVTHPDSTFEKEVVVIVNPSPDTSTIPYITTSSNVLYVVKGNYTTASVSLINSNSIDNSKWIWKSKNSRIADVIANNGTSAMICANGAGTTEITISHDECIYSLNLVIVVLDAAVTQNKPYISTDKNIITIQKGHSDTITASMIGGNSSSDNNYFRFNSSSSNLAINSSSNSCYLKAIEKGMYYITISNSRYSDSYSKTVLVIVEDKVEDGVYISLSQSIIKLKPDDKNLTKITATLVNGEATDGENFIWWIDDPNLVGLTSIADQCSIIPTGKSGTTKIHVKHEKSKNQADIVVMVSSYDKFAFSQNSANITAEKLYFYPMQVPSVEDEYKIEYSSSNTDVCIIDGSNAVAWVCAKDYGTATLTAKIVSETSKTILATCEMLVSVDVIQKAKPIVSLGNSILTVEQGTSKTFSAIITGENILESEKYQLKWSVKDKKSGITFLNETNEKTAYGSDVYVTFDQAGEYVLLCTHEESGSYSEMYIIVEEKGEMTIELNSSLETINIDDYSFTLTAIINNGSESDYKNIQWSAIKVGGQSIVKVSKTAGKTCTLVPQNVGQTTVIAKLSNGNIARCIVIVKATMELTFDVGAVHVVPGYTQIVNYKTTPDNVTVNWITQMKNASSSMLGEITNYFSIEDDTVKKQLRITGLKDYQNGVAGTISAQLIGASSANMQTIKVYVDYDLELRCETTEGNILTKLSNNNPDTKNTSKFNLVYYPTDLNIQLSFDSDAGNMVVAKFNGNETENSQQSNNKYLSCGNVTKTIIREEGIEKCKMTVDIVPHLEGEGTFTVKASLPNDKTMRYAIEKEFAYAAYYEKYDIELINLTDEKAFTKIYQTNKGAIDRIELSDGEEAIFYFKIKNENAKGELLDLKTNISSCWINYTNYCQDTALTSLSNTQIKNKLREELVTEIFDNITKDNIKDNISATKKTGLINFTKDNNQIDNQTVYRLAHIWDYYKDLPNDITDNKWENYYNTHNYRNNFIDDLKNNGVDYWLVTKEVYLDGQTAFKHPGKTQITAKWEKWNHHREWWNFMMQKHSWEDYLRYSLNGQKMLEIKNGGGNGDKNVTFIKQFTTCNPFVVSTETLKNNEVVVRPNQYEILGYSYSNGFLWFTPENAQCKEYLPKLLSPYITPTISKDTTPTKLGEASLIVSYKNAKGELNNISIPVTVVKRLCEAYTNNEWKKEGETWVLSEELFDNSLIGLKTPYLYVENSFIDTTSTEYSKNNDVLNIPYELYPEDAVLSVKIPKSSNKTVLELKNSNAVVVNNSQDFIMYSIYTHSNKTEGIGKDILQLKANNACNTVIEVNMASNGFNTTETIPITIRSDTTFEPVITSKTAYLNNAVSAKYSEVLPKNRLLIVSDGEVIKGSFNNIDTFSKPSNISVSYQPLSSTTNIKKDTKVDLKGKTQQDLVTVNLSGTNFTISHKKDYGYFSYDDKVQDEFYNKKYSLFNVSIDESSITYETVYKTQIVDGIEVQVIDTVATELNKEKAIQNAKEKELDKLKKSFVSTQGNNLRTNYDFSYYYENYNPVQNSKIYNYTPVGTFLITYDINNETKTEEIILCVKVMDVPCTIDYSLNYGGVVNEDYYLTK